MTTVYDVTVRRDGRWWFVDVPELGTGGQARTLREAAEVAREVIGLYQDVDPDCVAANVTVVLPEDVRAAWAEAKARESDARTQEAAAAVLARKAVRMARQQGFTLADTGQALGLSPQRVHQLAASP